MKLVRMKLLTIITEIDKEEKFTEVLNGFDIDNFILTRAYGTASPSILDYFGLLEVKKQIIMTFIPEYLEYDICVIIKQMLKKHGAGVCFTIPITASNKFIQEKFDPNKEVIKMEKSNKSLIYTIVSEGYYEDVMAAAKKAGAQGGTLIKGRGLQAKEATKILGISIDPEKEIVLIIVDNDIKIKVMEAINKKVGLNTDGKGICFSIPIDSAIGLHD